MVWSVTWPSSSEPRVVIEGITIRLGTVTGPIRAGVRRMFIVGSSLASHRFHLAAVDVDGGAVHPAAVRRHQEGDEGAEVLDLAEPADVELLAVLLAHRGFVAAG